MAIQSVTNDAEPEVFSGNDSSVYIAQAMAVADVLASGRNDQCDPQSLSDTGSLIYMLLRAASKLAETERKGLRDRMLAAEAKA